VYSLSSTSDSPGSGASLGSFNVITSPVVVPDSLSNGDQPLVVQTAGIQSTGAVNLTVQQ
jgi:hypothetical protein